jgi:hypothetical protein
MFVSCLFAQSVWLSVPDAEVSVIVFKLFIVILPVLVTVPHPPVNVIV